MEVIVLEKEKLQDLNLEREYSISLSPLSSSQHLCIKKNKGMDIKFILSVEYEDTVYKVFLDDKNIIVENFLQKANIKSPGIFTIVNLLFLGYSIDNSNFYSEVVFTARGYYFGISNYICSVDDLILRLGNDIVKYGINLPFSFNDYNSFKSEVIKCVLKGELSSSEDITDIKSIGVSYRKIISSWHNYSVKEDIYYTILKIDKLFLSLESLRRLNRYDSIPEILSTLDLVGLDINVNCRKEYLFAFKLGTLDCAKDTPWLIIKKDTINSLSKVFTDNKVTIISRTKNTLIFRVSNSVNPSIIYREVADCINSLNFQIVRCAFVSNSLDSCNRELLYSNYVYTSRFFNYVDSLGIKKFENVEANLKELYTKYKNNK